MSDPTQPSHERPRRRWRRREAPDPEAVERLAEATGLDELVAALLVQRGVDDVASARAFLAPSLEALHDPFALADMEALVEALEAALAEGATIGVHGDYDVDGLTATALLTGLLRDLGGDVRAFVPHRTRDGYGVADRAVERFAEAGVDLMVTLDTGISAHGPIGRARAAGMEVVVIDHHLPSDELPEARAVVDPARPDDAYPFDGLCSAGLAFKVGQALLAGRDEPVEDLLYRRLDLVALGTVCDLVPLIDENRVLTDWGLKVVRREPCLGVDALMSAVELDRDKVSAGTLGWVLGPRLNAVGRIADAADGLELLVTDDPERAHELAARIDRLNEQRRELTDRIERAAVEEIERRGRAEAHGLVLYGGEERETGPWHPGVIGIVASRLVDRYGRPTFLFAPDPASGGWKGSGRSPEYADVHLHDVLVECGDLLEAFGGHAGAAGATLAAEGAEHRQAFREAFEAAVRERVEAEDLVPVVEAHLEASLDRIDRDFYETLQQFAPFGEGNPEVQLLARGVEVRSVRRIGRNNTHLKLSVAQGGMTHEAVGWGLAEAIPAATDTPVPYRADLVFSIQENTYRGRTTLQLVVEDLRITDGRDQVTLDAIADREHEGADTPPHLFARGRPGGDHDDEG